MDVLVDIIKPRDFTALIGSRAASHWFPDFPRKCIDWDYIAANPIIWNLSNNERFEYHWNPAFEWLVNQSNLIKNGIATPNVLYTLKLSHSFWDIWWDKTMYDIQFLQSKNCQVVEELYNLCYLEWEKKHGKKNINLNQDNEEFFKDAVKRKVNHDDLHQWVAYGAVPYYQQLKQDPTKAWISQSMFFNLPYEEQLKVCREEAYVITLERYLIPANFKMSKLVAYRRALKILITRMTKGWFARFLSENYRTLKNLDDHDFVGRVREKL